MGNFATSKKSSSAKNISTKQLLFNGLDKKVHVLASLAKGFV
jgi:hypothetical protein